MPSSFMRRRARLLVLCALLANASVGQQPPAGSSSSRAKSKPVRVSPALEDGTFNNGIYRNRFFAFSYSVPYGWVDRTDRMQGDSEPGKSQVLLAVFERPPEAAGDSINSAVVIAAESMESYPGLKSAADYFGPLGELATAKGFKAIAGPYQTSIGAKTLVRQDFRRDIGELVMYQSSLVLLAKRYIASFIFIGGSADEIENLIATLHFEGAEKAPVKRR